METNQQTKTKSIDGQASITCFHDQLEQKLSLIDRMAKQHRIILKIKIFRQIEKSPRLTDGQKLEINFKTTLQKNNIVKIKFLRC